MFGKVNNKTFAKILSMFVSILSFVELVEHK